MSPRHAPQSFPPLVIVVGLPRSGTSWIGKILDSHPATFYLHEPDSRPSPSGVPFAPDASEWALHEAAILKFAATLPHNRNVRVVGKLPLFRKTFDVPGSLVARQLLAIGGKLTSRVIDDVNVPTLVPRHARPVLIWKSIQSTARLGTLARALPEARFVHIVRHPCGQAESIARGLAAGRFRSGHAPWHDSRLQAVAHTAQALRHRLSIDRAFALSACERIAWLWSVQNQKAQDETKDCVNVWRVRYEDFCADPLRASHRLLRHAGLPWSGQTERFIARSTSAHDDAFYALRKHPLLAANVWRERMDTQTARAVEAVVDGSPLWEWYNSHAASDA